MSGTIILIEEYGVGHAVAAIKNGRLIDFLIDPQDELDLSLVGSVMSVRVNEPKKGLNGTFVTLPGNRQGFLRGQLKFAKHSIVPVYIGVLTESHKAQPVSEKIILKGRYVILTPGNPGINVSKKIRSKAKGVRIIEEIAEFSTQLPKNCGLIVRSQAVDCDICDLIEESYEKLAQYNTILRNDLSVPQTLIGPLKARETAMQEWTFANSAKIFEEKCCFDDFGVWEQVLKFFESRVELENGGYLMLESTSAFVAIDINTGSDGTNAGALKTNLLAMRELPRQLEIRGLGGKIIIDFAPLSKIHRTKVESEFKTALSGYNSECIVVGWTKLGNLEIQKKRNKQPLSKLLQGDERFGGTK